MKFDAEQGERAFRQREVPDRAARPRPMSGFARDAARSTIALHPNTSGRQGICGDRAHGPARRPPGAASKEEYRSATHDDTVGDGPCPRPPQSIDTPPRTE